MKDQDVVSHNEMAWDQKVTDGAVWTIPVSREDIQKARDGIVQLSLGGNSFVPDDWFPESFVGKKILCIASGGGQQGPIFAATGAEVTVLDVSSKQLDRDVWVAKRENLSLRTVQGDMCDLSEFSNEYFDMVFCPVAITYIPDLSPFFKEVYRVLKPSGSFMLGSMNPHLYLFDAEKWDKGIYQVSNSLPFNSLDELNAEQAKEFIASKNALEYSHTMNGIMGGQLAVGFVIDKFYEDNDGSDLTKFFNNIFATRAIKP